MPPSFPPRSSFRRLALAALPVLALAGCGIADYEKKMQEAEVRVQRFDEENRLLGDPLVLPPIKDPLKDKEGPPFDVFLRPPKGVASKDKTQPGELAYHYPAAGGLCTDLYLTFGNADEERDKLERRIEALLGVAAQNWQPVEINHPFGRPALTFDAAEFIDPRAPANAPANIIAYCHQEAGQPAGAVVFRVPQTNRIGDATKVSDAAIKMSMQTYAERADASKARSLNGKPMASW